MDIVDPNPCMDVADPNPCRDVANLSMVLLIMVNENSRAEKPCSSYVPIIMITLYGLKDGLK